MVDDCTVFFHGPEHVRIFGGNPQVGDYLDNHRPENVSVAQKREELAQLSVQGPKSREILQKLTKQDLSNDSLPYYWFIENVYMAGTSVQVSRLGFTGELGYEIPVPASKSKLFWDELFAVVTPDGLLPAWGCSSYDVPYRVWNDYGGTGIRSHHDLL